MKFYAYDINIQKSLKWCGQFSEPTRVLVTCTIGGSINYCSIKGCYHGYSDF